MSVFAPTLGALWRQIESYGIDPAPLYTEVGIDPEILFDQGARIPVDVCQKLERRAAELSGDPDFGLKSAEYFRAAHLGALGFAWLASSTLRSALERLNRYARVIQDEMTIDLEEEDETIGISIDPHQSTMDQERREDWQLGALLKMIRTIAGSSFNPVRVLFQHTAPPDTGYYYELFRCPVEFSAPSTTLLIATADADKRLTGSNDQLAQLNEHIVVKYLAHSAKKDILNRVKAAIIDALASGSASEVVVAEAIHMTPRNMHRKLQKEGTSFRQLLNDVRQDLALQYIQDRSKTLTEISFLLGFSEVSSFSRAFKNWTGKPPSEARRNVA